jgi:hypothetical protein
MITHIVLLEPQAALSTDQRRSVLEAIEAATARCSSVRGCRVGRRIRQDLPGYEQRMRQDYEYALLLDFDDLDGLRQYLTHPAHAQLGEFFTRAAADALAYDYEMFDVREAHRHL